MPGPIRFLLSRSRSLGAAAIRAMPPVGQWSHVGLITEGGGEVIEARAFKGVVVTPLSDAMERASHWAIVDLRCPRPEDAHAWARSTIGAGYDWGGVFGIPFRQRSWEDEGRWYCTEWAAMAARKGGNPIWKVPQPHGLTVNHLFSLLLAADGKITAERT
jgi:uncharacterized protein YycO